jgi:hypothetical protein
MEPLEIEFATREAEESARALIARDKQRLWTELLDHPNYSVPTDNEAALEWLKQRLFGHFLEALGLRNEGEYLLWRFEQAQRTVRQRARQERDGYDKLRSFCQSEDEFSFLVDAMVHAMHPELMAQVPERSRIILERRWSDKADEHIFQSIAKERRCSIAEIRGLYDAGLRCLLALRAERSSDRDQGSEMPEQVTRHGTGLATMPRVPAVDASTISDLSALGTSDLLDASRYVGWAVREHGRFGSFPLHDDYGDEAHA